jgi:hypothetical protein
MVDINTVNLLSIYLLKIVNMTVQNKREREREREREENKEKTMICKPVFAVKQCKTW